MNHLHPLFALLGKGGAQALMARNHRVETAFQRGDVQGAFEAQGAGDVIGAAVGVHLPEEPLAFLGIG
ncbi:hypothetical protein D3C85_228460 [compost metagenome]